MATVWAKSNGNWSATTLWAFWNEATQQIEDYGQVPQEGDTVYANGFTVSYNITTVNNTLRNDTNPYTGFSNGSFSYPYATITINGDCYIGDVNLFSGSYTRPINYNGNIIKVGAGGIYVRNQSTININGNVIIEESATGILFYKPDGTVPHSFVINGNLAINSGTFGETLGATTINGNCLIKGTLCQSTNASTKSVSGRCDIYTQQNSFALRVENILNIYGITQTFTSLQINKIHYYGTGYNLGINVASIGIIDVSQFEAKRIYDTPDYPSESNVKKDVSYDYGQMVGTYDLENLLPPESVVLKDYEYGDEDDPKTGTMVQEVNVEVGCVTPEDVRKDVPLVGMGVVGSLVVPSVDDVREGVVFDNGSVGTLIVQGGGDRLRIADFGYYTNAQSDTYIVDLTEQDKPKFAVAEERVLIEMFPDLDLNNIPDKYFDDLFVKYLKYRLIVEYYRTAGINSTFTPSEPTTEIVNYQNVRNEVWLNSANIYLKAWSKKYPESIVKPQRILL